MSALTNQPSNDLPPSYHSSRTGWMHGNMGGIMTPSAGWLARLGLMPTTPGTPHSTAHVVGGNSPSSLHYIFGNLRPHSFGE